LALKYNLSTQNHKKTENENTPSQDMYSVFQDSITRYFNEIKGNTADYLQAVTDLQQEIIESREKHAKNTIALQKTLSEQFGKTISHAKPVVDATLPDGSRINIVFGKDISRKGTNATIRKFASTPLSIIQVLTSGVMNFTEVAYLWMMLEAGMSLFVNGETASGKTTTLMGLTAFIPANWKVVTIEDTPELTLPHNNWITEATRNTGNAASSVTMDDLLKAALRQRPNYILVGEIRGAEGNIAFQAMQTGHPVISTFHAANMVSLIQRLSNDPINIPKTHMENLNIALFQGAVQGPGGKRVRRVLSINEILGYNPQGNNIMFIPVFNWDPGTDTTKFRGKGSSRR